MKEASRDLLASREDVWRFLSEPYHLADWWPRLTSVEPDRRGFGHDARWQVSVVEEPFGFRLAAAGRLSGPLVRAPLLVTDIKAPELWAWRLIRSGSGMRMARMLDVTVRLAAVDPVTTRATVAVSGSGGCSARLFGSRDAALARAAVDRLYELVQTAATL